MGAKENNLRHEALEFTKLLVEQYFVHRKLDVLQQFFDKGITWIGTRNHIISQNLDEVIEALAKELAEYSGYFTVKEQWFEAMQRSDTLCVVYGVVQALPEDEELPEENLRLSLVLEKTAEGMKLVHLHVSHPDQAQKQVTTFKLTGDMFSASIMKLRQKQGMRCYPPVLKSYTCKKTPQERSVRGMITRKIGALKKLVGKRDILLLAMSLMLAGLTGWWSIPYAEAVRGYFAVGGEYCLIMMMAALPWVFQGVESYLNGD